MPRRASSTVRTKSRRGLRRSNRSSALQPMPCRRPDCHAGSNLSLKGDLDMTIKRRTVLAGLAAAVGTLRVARAQSWRGQYPELVYAVVPAENATGVLDRFAPFVDYLNRELG